MKRITSRVVRIALLCAIAPTWAGVVSASAVSTIVGATGNGPRGIVLDASGNVYTANSGSDNVSKITPSGVSSVLGVTGDQPMSIVADSLGNLYIPNNQDNTVTKMGPNGTVIATYVLGAKPTDIAVDLNNNLFVSCDDSLPGTVKKIDPSGNITNIALPAGSFGPIAIAVDTSGNVYTSNFQSDNVSKIPVSGPPQIFANTGASPIDIAIDAAGNVYTANYTDNTVTKITPDGTSQLLGSTGRSPVGLAVDSGGNVYTTNFLDATVSRITPSGVSSIYGTTANWPFAITIDSVGNLFVTNGNGSDVVTKLSRPTPVVAATPLGVTFDTQGGSPLAKGTTINGGSVTDPGAPTRNGYTFLGWNTAANGTGTAITFPYHHTNSSDFTLYAQWRATVSTAPTTTPPTTVVMPLIPEELPSTGGEFAMWPLLFIAAGFALITLRRFATTR